MKTEPQFNPKVAVPFTVLLIALLLYAFHAAPFSLALVAFSVAVGLLWGLLIWLRPPWIFYISGVLFFFWPIVKRLPTAAIRERYENWFFVQYSSIVFLAFLLCIFLHVFLRRKQAPCETDDATKL